MELLTLKSALGYVSNGFSIIPLLPGTKIPCKTDDFLNGFHSATTNQELILDHWNQERYVSSNIGLKLGKDENIVCIDIDNKSEDKNGFKTIEVIERELQPLPPTYTVKTLSGEHRFYQYPKGVDLRRQINAFDSIDVLADGYCVSPPSIVDGKQYEKVSGSLLELAPFPKFLLPLLIGDTSDSMVNLPREKLKQQDFHPKKRGRKLYTGKFLDELVNGAKEGNRNDWIVKMTAKMLSVGTSLNAAYELILIANQHFLEEPLCESEVNKTFMSIVKKDRKGA